MNRYDYKIYWNENKKRNFSSIWFILITSTAIVIGISAFGAYESRNHTVQASDHWSIKRSESELQESTLRPCRKITEGRFDCTPLEIEEKAKLKPLIYVQTETIEIVTTAYTSSIAETDGSPCEAANGEDICKLFERGDKTCAANFLPFGTRVSIPIYGTCTVRDRMAHKFSRRLDLYFGGSAQKSKALEWGKRKEKITIYYVRQTLQNP